MLKKLNLFIESIPTIRMLSYTLEELEKRGNILLDKIKAKDLDLVVSMEDEYSTIGGGSMPGEVISSKVIEISTDKFSVSKLEEKLRLSNSHIIGRIHEDRYMLDIRTIQDDEFDIIAYELEDLFK